MYTEALKGPDGKPLPISDKEKNDAAYAEKARKFKEKNKGVTDYTAFKAGGGSSAVKNTGNLGNNRTARDVQNAGTRELKRQSDAKAAQKDREKKYGGNDLLTNLAGAGSKDAKAIQSKITKADTTKTDTTKTDTTKTEPSRTTSQPSSSSTSSSSSSTASPKPATPKPSVKPAASNVAAAANAAVKTQANKNFASGQLGRPSSSSPSPKPAASAPKPVSGIKSSRLSNALSGVKKFKAENYDAIVRYMVGEGYAPNEEAAVAIVEHMSDAWVVDLME